MKDPHRTCTLAKNLKFHTTVQYVSVRKYTLQVFYMFIKIGFCLSRNLHYNNQPEEAQDYDQESLLQISYRVISFQ